MKSSCIRHPKKEALIIIRKWQMEFCDDNACAAALLSYLEYWHNIKLAVSQKAHEANNIREMHGERRTQDESLIQFHGEQELEDGIMIYKHGAIAAAIKLLVGKGVIKVQTNPNPKFKFDRTRHFLFYSEILNTWLDNRPDTSSEKGSPSYEKGARTAEKSQPLPETSSKTSSEEYSILETSIGASAPPSPELLETYGQPTEIKQGPKFRICKVADEGTGLKPSEPERASKESVTKPSNLAPTFVVWRHFQDALLSDSRFKGGVLATRMGGREAGMLKRLIIGYEGAVEDPAKHVCRMIDCMIADWYAYQEKYRCSDEVPSIAQLAWKAQELSAAVSRGTGIIHGGHRCSAWAEAARLRGEIKSAAERGAW